MGEKRGKRAGVAAVRGIEMIELLKAGIAEIVEDLEAETEFGDPVIEAEIGDAPEAETDTGAADPGIDTGVVDQETDIGAADLEIDIGDLGAETGEGAEKEGKEKGAGAKREKVNLEDWIGVLFLPLEEELIASFTSEMFEAILPIYPLLPRRGMPGQFSVCNSVRELELEMLRISSQAWEKFEM